MPQTFVLDHDRDRVQIKARIVGQSPKHFLRVIRTYGIKATIASSQMIREACQGILRPDAENVVLHPLLRFDVIQLQVRLTVHHGQGQSWRQFVVAKNQ